MPVTPVTESSSTRPTFSPSVAMREFRCASCGYGISVARLPETCPMCRSTLWEPAAWRPFSAATSSRP
jgi:rubrerythrin